MEITAERFDEQKPAKNHNGHGWVRLMGFLFLFLIGMIIIFLFKFPEYLNGPMGIVIPVSLFVLLFAAFYSLIISMKI